MLELPYEEKPVRAVHRPGRDEFLGLVNAARAPFKVTGSMDQWELCHALSRLDSPAEQCDFMAQLAKEDQVHFTVVPPEQKGILGLNDKLQQNFSFKSRQTSFPDFIQLAKQYVADPARGTLYLQSTPIAQLNDKLGALDLFQGFHPRTKPRFWIGTGRQFVSLHNDPQRNIIAVFTGRKRVIMFPPEELPNLYPAPFDVRVGGVIQSLVNAYDPDLEKFPAFKKALERVQVAVVNPGEFLYMPPLWWHAVEGEGFNVGLNCWFQDEGPSNVLETLYVPAETLMLSLNSQDIAPARRKALYAQFMQVLGGANAARPSGKLEAQVAREAKKIKATLDGTPLVEDQKNLWKRWVDAFAAQYIFRLDNNPFPSLPEREFPDMIKRFQHYRKRGRLKRVIHWIRTLFRPQRRGRIDNHGIVP